MTIAESKMININSTEGLGIDSGRDSKMGKDIFHVDELKKRNRRYREGADS